MKKTAVLLALFVLPLVFYIFLSKGIYHYSNLPILTDEVNDVKNDNNISLLEDHLSIVCFLGNDMQQIQGTIFNLNQTIYKRFYQKPYFQIVAIFPKDNIDEVEELKKELATFTDLKGWNFVGLTNKEINSLFESFKTPFKLGDKNYSKHAFIVDKKLRLRGRKNDEDEADGKLYGYDMQSVAVLKNKMIDDIEIIYYQYKKSAEKEQRRRK